MIKLIAVDMDGTFLRNDDSYDTDRFAKIYQRLEKNNIKFVVASGNQYFQLVSFFKNYPDVLYIAENGALIRSQKQIIKLHQYAMSTVNKIEQFLIKQPELKFLVCGSQYAYELTKFGQDYYNNYARYYFHLKQVNNFDEIQDKILKFAVTCPPKKTDYFVKLLKDNLSPQADVTSSGHGDIDIIQPGLHKANGLKELGSFLGISTKEMCAFGDGGNDLEMIKEVGDGVAMANAIPELKTAANHVTKSNEEQGVLTYLEQMLDNLG